MNKIMRVVVFIVFNPFTLLVSSVQAEDTNQVQLNNEFLSTLNSMDYLIDSEVLSDKSLFSEKNKEPEVQNKNAVNSAKLKQNDTKLAIPNSSVVNEILDDISMPENNLSSVKKDNAITLDVKKKDEKTKEITNTVKSNNAKKADDKVKKSVVVKEVKASEKEAVNISPALDANKISNVNAQSGVETAEEPKSELIELVLNEDRLLSQDVDEWVKKRGYKLFWKSDKDYVIYKKISILGRDDYEVLSNLGELLSSQSYNLNIKLFSKNNVIVIEEN